LPRIVPSPLHPPPSARPPRAVTITGGDGAGGSAVGQLNVEGDAQAAGGRAGFSAGFGRECERAGPRSPTSRINSPTLHPQPCPAPQQNQVTAAGVKNLAASQLNIGRGAGAQANQATLAGVEGAAVGQLNIGGGGGGYDYDYGPFGGYGGGYWGYGGYGNNGPSSGGPQANQATLSGAEGAAVSQLNMGSSDSLGSDDFGYGGGLFGRRSGHGGGSPQANQTTVSGGADEPAARPRLFHRWSKFGKTSSEPADSTAVTQQNDGSGGYDSCTGPGC